MSRATRLLDLLQALRRRKRPVQAATLSAELGVSVRTIYRDIDTLRAQGAGIDANPGLGFVLRAGFVLPPLRFTTDELDALMLGLSMVELRCAGDLDTAARDAFAKIAAVLPEDGPNVQHTLLQAAPRDHIASPHLRIVRQALHDEHALELCYRDKNDHESTRVIWPVLLGFFGELELLAAWCETRQAFRHFRIDRIVSLTSTARRYPKRRRMLMAQWRALQGMDDQHS